MARALLLAALLLPGCGEPGAAGNKAATANQIERLSTPRVEKADPEASARLQPITLEDLEREGLLGAGCDFSLEGHTLLVAVGSDAVVRVEGALRHLIHSAPVGPTGGFFEDRQLSVSVGRTEEAGTAGNALAGSAARITVTNRRTEVQREMIGTWRCGA